MWVILNDLAIIKSFYCLQINEILLFYVDLNKYITRKCISVKECEVTK